MLWSIEDEGENVFCIPWQPYFVRVSFTTLYAECTSAIILAIESDAISFSCCIFYSIWCVVCCGQVTQDSMNFIMPKSLSVLFTGLLCMAAFLFIVYMIEKTTCGSCYIVCREKGISLSSKLNSKTNSTEICAKQNKNCDKVKELIEKEGYILNKSTPWDD